MICFDNDGYRVFAGVAHPHSNFLTKEHHYWINTILGSLRRKCESLVMTLKLSDKGQEGNPIEEYNTAD